METTISFYGKGNDIIPLAIETYGWSLLLCVGLGLVLIERQLLLHAMSLLKHASPNLLHQICFESDNNDIVRQGPKTISGDDNTHSSVIAATVSSNVS